MGWSRTLSGWFLAKSMCSSHFQGHLFLSTHLWFKTSQVKTILPIWFKKLENKTRPRAVLGVLYTKSIRFHIDFRSNFSLKHRIRKKIFRTDLNPENYDSTRALPRWLWEKSTCLSHFRRHVYLNTILSGNITWPGVVLDGFWTKSTEFLSKLLEEEYFIKEKFWVRCAQQKIQKVKFYGVFFKISFWNH